MKSRKGWFFGIGTIAILGIGYRFFGYKMTVGNLIGMRVNRIALVDTKDQKAFDLDGHPVSMDDPFVSQYKPSDGKVDPIRRRLIFSISGSKGKRIKFDGLQNSSTGGSDEKVETMFPVQNTSSSIPYQIESTADDWQQIDSWDLRSHSKNFNVFDEAGGLTITVRNVPRNDPENIGEEFKVDFNPSDKNGNYGGQTLNGSENVLRIFHPGKVSDFKGFTISRRSYHVVSKGLMAFGAKGSEATLIKPDHQVVVSSITRPHKNSFEGDRWNANGKMIPFVPNEGINFQSDTRGKTTIYQKIRALVGERGQGVKLEAVANPRLTIEGYFPTGRIIDDRVEFEFFTFVDPTYKVADINFYVSSGPMKEVVRTKVLSHAKLGSEPKGAAVVEPYRNKWTAGLSRVNYWIKIPDEYKDSDLRMGYLDDKNVIHYVGVSTRNAQGYYGMPFDEPESSLESIKGFVLEARKRRKVTVKNVHLQPELAKSPSMKLTN